MSTKNGIPAGVVELTSSDLRRIDIYFHKEQRSLIITGTPPSEEEDPDCEKHHCDAMGCQGEHVLQRIPLSVEDVRQMTDVVRWAKKEE